MRTRISSAVSHPRFRLIIGLTLLALMVAGCGLTPVHTPRASDQWSNGRLAGTATLNNLVAFQIDEGESDALSVFMVWVGLESELNFVRLNERAEVLVETTLELHSESPLKPQMLKDPTGQLHLTWLDSGMEGLQLYYARLSGDGEVIQDATVLSLAEQRAAHSVMVLNPVDQTVEIFWSDNAPARPGISHAALDWSGKIVDPMETLIADGSRPSAQIDRQGFVHLAWRVEPVGEEADFRYAVYDPQRRVLGPITMTVEPMIQMSLLGGPTAGARFLGPWLGLDEQSGYLAWMVESRERGGLLASTFFQSFQLPALTRSETMSTFEYAPPDTVGDTIHVQGVDPTVTGHPGFLAGQPTRQALTCYTQAQSSGNVETLQIAVMDVLAGKIEGQDIVSDTRAASLQPNIAIDTSGHLHLTWIDTAGFNRYQVIYASTSPQAKETLNRISTYEVVDAILSTVMNVFSALFFLPMVLTWVFIPIAWLVLFTLTTREFEITNPRGPFAFGMACLLQLVVKPIFFSDLLSQVPLGIAISPTLSSLLGRWVIPLILTVVSAVAARIFTQRTRSSSLFTAYFVYAAIDSILTLVIYVAFPLMG